MVPVLHQWFHGMFTAWKKRIRVKPQASFYTLTFSPHMVPVLHTWFLFSTHGSCSPHMVPVLHQWFHGMFTAWKKRIRVIPQASFYTLTFSPHMVPVLHTWFLFSTHGSCSPHMVPVLQKRRNAGSQTEKNA